MASLSVNPCKISHSGSATRQGYLPPLFYYNKWLMSWTEESIKVKLSNRTISVCRTDCTNINPQHFQESGRAQSETNGAQDNHRNRPSAFYHRRVGFALRVLWKQSTFFHALFGLEMSKYRMISACRSELRAKRNSKNDPSYIKLVFFST